MVKSILEDAHFFGLIMVMGNSFCIRQGSRVTCDFPVITGLREGSVLSPLLFILFVADMGESVLRPFSKSEFLKRDPELNCIPTPGLLYADDLVLVCLTADLLRERLRRLSDYAYSNSLTVNVPKCEIVVFGKRRHPSQVFKFEGQSVPVRRSCKYLGVWLDGDLSGRALADSVTEKFRAAVPTFFSLCRRLRVANLDVVFRLANALVFSLLYGCEFLRRIDIVETCEKAWWKGVRSFYGLPPGVSSPFVRLLFPRFSLVHRVLEAKFNLLRRGSHPLPTLFPEALLADRGVLFSRGRKGYSQILFDWCSLLGLSDLFFEYERVTIRSALVDRKAAQNDQDWLLFSEMDSTRFAASLLPSRHAVFSVLLEASRLSKLGVRALMLIFSGSLTLSYTGSRFCFCGGRSSFEHFVSCDSLGPNLVPTVQLLVQRESWKDLSVLFLSRFHVFLQATRGGQLTIEESELFDQVFHVDDVDVTPVAELFV
jgi:hypothetical protein